MNPNLNNILTVPQALNVLFQALQIGQSKGIYTFSDSYKIKLALDALQVRLHLNENMQPIITEPLSSPLECIAPHQCQTPVEGTSSTENSSTVIAITPKNQEQETNKEN